MEAYSENREVGTDESFAEPVKPASSSSYRSENNQHTDTGVAREFGGKVEREWNEKPTSLSTNVPIPEF